MLVQYDYDFCGRLRHGSRLPEIHALDHDGRLRRQQKERTDADAVAGEKRIQARFPDIVDVGPRISPRADIVDLNAAPISQKINARFVRVECPRLRQRIGAPFRCRRQPDYSDDGWIEIG